MRDRKGNEAVSRIPNFVRPGELLKRPGMYTPKRVKPAFKSPREKDDVHLLSIRQCQCVACGGTDKVESAHVRMASGAHGKRSGMGEKPDDKWTVPLCQRDHRRQHEIGELTFWHELRISPVQLAIELYAASPDIQVMRAIVARHRKQT